jgi:hypothetical protein
VAVYGALPRNWASLRDCFQPLGERFLLSSPTEMEIEPLASRLNAAAR